MTGKRAKSIAIYEKWNGKRLRHNNQFETIDNRFETNDNQNETNCKLLFRKVEPLQNFIEKPKNARVLAGSDHLNGGQSTLLMQSRQTKPPCCYA